MISECDEGNLHVNMAAQLGGHLLNKVPSVLYIEEKAPREKRMSLGASSSLGISKHCTINPRLSCERAR